MSEFVLPYEREAMQGLPIPENLSWYDKKIYIMLRSLYAEYKRGNISRETAKKDKKEIMKEYGNLVFAGKLLDTAHERYKATEEARREYAKNRTLENAERMLQAFDGLLTKM